MGFFSSFVFVLAILIFQVLLHEGKIKGTGALFVAIIVSGICCVALVFFVLGVIAGGQVVSGH